MARDRSPITKQSRREGVALHPKALRIMVKRTSPPGANARGGMRRSRPSQYSLQLREKQKTKRTYGLLEKQFRNLVKEATNASAQTGELLLSLLERRLDNAVYRAGFAPSRRAARQVVGHGHFMLNGKRVDIPSIRLKPGDKVTLRPASHKNDYFKNLDNTMENVEQFSTSWLNVDRSNFSFTVTSLPLREDGEQDISEQLIIEYYSR